MKNDLKNFIKELKRHYSPKSIGALLFFIVILLIPIITIANKIRFNYSEFANIYLSTVFTAVLIGITLKVIDLYNVSLVNYSKTYNLLMSLNTVLINIRSNINTGETNMGFYGDLLIHYKTSLANSLIFDDQINEKLLLLYKSNDLEYLIESFKLGQNLTSNKKQEVNKKIESLLQILAKTKILL